MRAIIANGAAGVTAAGGILGVNWISHANTAITLAAGVGGLIVIIYTIINARLTNRRNMLEIEKLQREIASQYEPRN